VGIDLALAMALYSAKTNLTLPAKDWLELLLEKVPWDQLNFLKAASSKSIENNYSPIQQVNCAQTRLIVSKSVNYFWASMKDATFFYNS